MIYIVDTHALIWHLTNSPRLGNGARELLSDTAATFVIPTIVLAEARFLSMRGRVPLAWEETISRLDADPRCVVYPLDRTVVDHLPPGLNIHDGIICATALVCKDALGEEVQVITRDERIIASGLVDTVW